MPSLILVVGILLRAQLLLLDRALWRDELMLALGLRDSSWSELFGPLPYHQKAPLLYLLFNKLVIEIVGPSEWGLRTLSFVAGVGALLLFASVVRRAFGTLGQAVSLLALATSDWATRYAAEAKPYGVDLGVAVLGLWVLQRASVPGRTWGPWRLAGLALLAALSTGLSFPATFVFGAAALTLTILPSPSRGGNRRAAGMALGAGTAATAGSLYLLLYRPMTSDAFLLDYFASALAPFPWPPGNTLWYVRTATEFFHSPVGMLHVRGAGLLIGTVGLIAALRAENRSTALFICVTVLLTIVASMLMNYPMAGRLLLFLLPMALWLFGAACDLRSSDALARTWALAAALFVLSPGLINAARGVLRPMVLEDPRPLLAQFRDWVRPGDVVYLHEFAFPGFRWYAPDLAAADSGLRVVQAPFGDLLYYDTEVLRERIAAQLAGHARVWILDAEGRYSHRWLMDEIGSPRADVPQVTGVGFRGTLYDTRTPVKR